MYQELNFTLGMENWCVNKCIHQYILLYVCMYVCMYNQLYTYLCSRNILSDSQSGFRSNHSTTTLLEVHDYILNNMDKGFATLSLIIRLCTILKQMSVLYHFKYFVYHINFMNFVFFYIIINLVYRKFLSNRIGASKRDIWTRAGNVTAPSLKY